MLLNQFLAMSLSILLKQEEEIKICRVLLVPIKRKIINDFLFSSSTKNREEHHSWSILIRNGTLWMPFKGFWRSSLTFKGIYPYVQNFFLALHVQTDLLETTFVHRWPSLHIHFNWWWKTPIWVSINLLLRFLQNIGVKSLHTLQDL